MKLKITSLLVAVLSIAPLISSGQEKAPAAPAAEAKAKGWVPSTPLEKKAKALVATMSKIPVIMVSIKDQATLDVASKSIAALNKEIDAHVAEINKLPVPDAATRNALSARMEKESAPLGEAMQKSMLGLAALPPEFLPKVQEMMTSFVQNTEKHEGPMNKYFESDKERAKKKGQ